MQYEKKYFGNGSGNFDDADFVLQPNQWINMENCRVGSTDKGVVGTVESVGSTTLLSTIQPSITNVMIGAIDDPTNNRIIYFLKDIYGPFDKIVAYDVNAKVFYTVLLSDQVVGGLNFQRFTYIHSPHIINGLLFWTDYFNQPRRLNINAGINLNHPGTFPLVVSYVAQLTAEVITIIRKPPYYPLTFEKIEDVDVETNQIKNSAFRFAYQYIYRDGERSTLSPHSLLAYYNFPNETFNAIRVFVSFAEKPDQDVQLINIIVIYADGENGYTIKTWDKANAADAAEIAAHVAGTSQLNFEFANDAVGDAIDNATLVKPYDSVPLLSEALEQGTNRVFLGRNLIGYNTPTETSLSVIIVQQNSEEGVSGRWVQVGWSQEGGGSYLGYIAYFPTPIDATHPAGFYDFTANPLLEYLSPPFPPEIDIDDYTYISDPNTVDGYIYLSEYYIPTVLGYPVGAGIAGYSLDSGDVVVTSNTIVGGNVPILKSDSPYRLGVVFYDRYLRQCGVITGTTNRITTPDRAYVLSAVYDYGIQWNLDAGAQPDEIPDWAFYYSIVSTKSLRTSFFMQARAGDIVYVTKDPDGVYVFTSTTYVDSNFGIGLKLDILSGYGMGYSFQQNDIVKVYIEGGSTIFTLAIIDQAGEWLIAELANLGSLATTNAFFEIYTPRQQSAAEIFYEVGQFFTITNPGTAARRYDTTQGFLPGDVYLLERGTSPGTYLTENMSPNTTLWRNWFTNTGRIQIIDRIGQRRKDTSIKWSNTFIPGTLTNGLSTFDSLDEKILPGEMGPLRKLLITSKVGNELGVVMLGICELETASMYLGEQQLVGSAANAFIAQATDVIGTVNVLKGEFGTTNPESVTEFKGNAYWVDVRQGKVIQYSLNGLFPISKYKMTRYWKQFYEAVSILSGQDLLDLNFSPFIVSTVDPHHWELLITVPRVTVNPPLGYLPDPPYTGYIYPFDIWDGQAKTLVYKINAEPNFWQGSYSFFPEGYITMLDKLYSFKFGQLYEHNSTDSYCNFNGQQYTSRIMFVCNQQPERPKVYDNMAVEANMLPTLTYFMSLAPYTQVSNLQDFDYENKEGVLYSQIYRNILTPTATGLKVNGLVTGEKMRTYAFRVMLEFTVSTFPVELRFVNLGYQLSLGHSIPTQ